MNDAPAPGPVDLTRVPDAWDETTWFADDLTPGASYDLGPHLVDEAELVAFALQWDPQFFHVDRAAAERGAFGGLIASGMHTLSVFQRLAVPGFWGRLATIAARGMSDVRFLAPVRPGDRLDGVLEVRDVATLDAHRALVTVVGGLTRGDESRAPVLGVVVEVLVARRG